MITREQLQRLARLRLSEAEELFAAGLYDGCVYLCGYVIEMALKACVCKALDVPTYPDSEQGLKQAFKTHDFSSLLLLAGLRSVHAVRQNASTEFAANWSLAVRWTPDDRYVPDRNDRLYAHDMLEALRSTPEGIFTWLSQQW